MLLCGPLWVFCGSFVVLCNPLRYLVIPEPDTSCYFSVRSKAEMSQLNLVKSTVIGLQVFKMVHKYYDVCAAVRRTLNLFSLTFVGDHRQARTPTF